MVQGRGFCCIGLLPALMAILAVAASVITTGWCQTVKFSPDANANGYIPGGTNVTSQTQSILSNSEGFAELQFGLFYFQNVQDIRFDSAKSSYGTVKNSCVGYDKNNTDMDVAWKIARIFAIIAPIVGALLAFALLVSPCIVFFSKQSWTKMAIAMLVLMPLLQGMTLLVLTSDLCKNNPVIEQRFKEAMTGLSGGDSMTTAHDNNNATGSTGAAGNNNNNNGYGVDQNVLKSIYGGDCEWDWGIYAQIVSMILFFLAGIVMLVMGAPVRPEPKEPEIQQVTYEQKPDGENGGEPTVEEVDVITLNTKSDVPPWTNTSHQSTPHGRMEQAKLY